MSDAPMTGPSSGDRPAEETYADGWRAGYRTAMTVGTATVVATPPAVRTGDETTAEPTREDQGVAAGLVRRARAANSDVEVDDVRDRIAREIATERALVPPTPPPVSGRCRCGHGTSRHAGVLGKPLEFCFDCGSHVCPAFRPVTPPAVRTGDGAGVMACACGAGVPGQGVDPGVCSCQGSTGLHCRCVHLPLCPECGRAGWHTYDCTWGALVTDRVR